MSRRVAEYGHRHTEAWSTDLHDVWVYVPNFGEMRLSEYRTRNRQRVNLGASEELFVIMRGRA